jgi:hypothetical protein
LGELGASLWSSAMVVSGELGRSSLKTSEDGRSRETVAAERVERVEKVEDTGGEPALALIAPNSVAWGTRVNVLSELTATTLRRRESGLSRGDVSEAVGWSRNGDCRCWDEAADGDGDGESRRAWCKAVPDKLSGVYDGLLWAGIDGAIGAAPDGPETPSYLGLTNETADDEVDDNADPGSAA